MILILYPKPVLHAIGGRPQPGGRVLASRLTS
jgi:hypothetical protein